MKKYLLLLLMAALTVSVCRARITIGETSADADAPELELQIIESGDAPYTLLGVDLNDLLLGIAQKSGLTYVANPLVDKKVRGYFSSSDPLRMGREAALANGFVLNVSDKIMTLRNAELEAAIPKETFIYEFAFLHFPDLEKDREKMDAQEQFFSSLLLLNQPGGEYCKYHPKANALIVHAAPSKVAELKSILQRLDRARPLIRVQVDIVDVDNRPARIIGADLTNTLGSAAKPFTIDFVNSIASALTGAFTPLFAAWDNISSTHLASVFQPPQVSAVFHAMESKGLLKVVARMVSVSEDNTPGKITAARQEPIPNFSANQTTGGFDINGFEYKDIGSVGLCTPTIVGAAVRVKLKSSLSSSDATRTFSSSGGTGGGLNAEIPIIDTREVDTTISVPLGKTRIIGGLGIASEKDNSNKIPFLGDWLPYLFSHTNRQASNRTLALAVTVTLLDEALPAETLPDIRVLNNSDAAKNGWFNDAVTPEEALRKALPVNDRH